MNFEVNDIIQLGSSLYRILEIKNNGVPNIIQPVYTSNYKQDKGRSLKDYGNEWHTLSWKLVQKSVPPYQLSIHDKKYEKIILKIKQLDDKFKNKNKIKDVEYQF